jgi:hypothetical protein
VRLMSGTPLCGEVPSTSTCREAQARYVVGSQ